MTGKRVLTGISLLFVLATLAACGNLPIESVRDVGAVGEVSLDGLVRPTRGMLSVAESAGKIGVNLLITPIEGLATAAEVSTVPLAGVRSLAEAVLVLRDHRTRMRVIEPPVGSFSLLVQVRPPSALE